MLAVIARRNGLSSMDSLWDSFHRDFGRAFNQYSGNPGDQMITGAYPVDIHEDDEHIYVDAELPGFKKNEIDVTLENGVLAIEAQRKAEETKGQRHLTERRFTRVARRFTVPNTVDENTVDAKLLDGVLHLALNKREEVKPRRITVN